ncbi:MAG TPA: HAMP domain-containing histidine kinase, partial [Dehalococcoidia bacterium]|nr:HAMP domain-containing histidine kinase [Dehalococcoidia bacterium]
TVSDELMDDAPYVKGDSSQLTQVFMNLIINAEEAVAYSPRKELMISSRIEGEWIKVSVTDSGTGIPPENLNQVFYPFFTTKHEIKGTGLGLSTCYGIITDHGGLIRAENNRTEGATFTIELPLASNRHQERLLETTAAPS